MLNWDIDRQSSSIWIRKTGICIAGHLGDEYSFKSYDICAVEDEFTESSDYASSYKIAVAMWYGREYYCTAKQHYKSTLQIPQEIAELCCWRTKWHQK